MIVAPPGLSARYKNETPETGWMYRRIVAFDDDWHPFVISDNNHLERAEQSGDYDGIIDNHDFRGRYIALMPAAGWRIEYTTREATWSEPLVGWAIKNGMIVPLITDSLGEVDDIDDLDMSGDQYRIYHPDATGPDPAGDSEDT